MKRLILLILALLPLAAISFSAQAALKADSPNSSLESKRIGGSESGGLS